MPAGSLPPVARSSASLPSSKNCSAIASAAGPNGSTPISWRSHSRIWNRRSLRLKPPRRRADLRLQRLLAEHSMQLSNLALQGPVIRCRNDLGICSVKVLTPGFRRLNWAEAPPELLMLAMHTGQRQGDSCSSSPGRREMASAFRCIRAKGGRLVEIRQPRRYGARCRPRAGLASHPHHPHRTGLEEALFHRAGQKACEAAGITDLYFHDLRGTAVTMLAEAGCTIPEIAAVTGRSVASDERILETASPGHGHWPMWQYSSWSAVCKTPPKPLMLNTGKCDRLQNGPMISIVRHGLGPGPNPGASPIKSMALVLIPRDCGYEEERFL
jgi:hypothetical protein